MKTILNLTARKARAHLLKEESYFNFDLPKYFVFQNVIRKVSKKISDRRLSDFYSEKHKPCRCEGVNYTFLNNKDGKYAWRPFQLIHPALYVSLVHSLTEEENWKLIRLRFKRFRQNPRIHCCSIPPVSETQRSDKAAGILNWWQSIEQASIELALSYEYVLHTDISDCYGSIATSLLMHRRKRQPQVSTRAGQNSKDHAREFKRGIGHI